MFNPNSRTTIFAALGLLLGFILPVATEAQQRGRRIYDPATEVTLKGVVEDVKTDTCRDCGFRGMGTHLLLKVETETVDVRLGPSSFLQEKNYTFSKGDQLEVTGSKVKIGDADVVIAREIKKGDAVLTLRDAQGIPEWRGGRRRP